jgi:Kiwa KwaB-like protein
MAVSKSRARLRSLLQLDLSRYEVAVCLASYTKDQRVPEHAHLQLRETLESTFREIAAFTLEQLRRQVGLRTQSYQLDSNPDGDEIEYVDLAVSPFDLIREQVEELDHPVVGMPAFHQESTFLQRVRYYTIVLRLRGVSGVEPICFFRQYQPMRRLGRGWLAAVWSEHGYYDRVAPANLFLFDEGVDAIKSGNILFVLDKPRFHQMFRFFEELTATVDESMHTLCGRIGIDDVEAFAEACRRDPRKAARLRSIVQKPYMKQLDMQRIGDFITVRKLEIQVKNGQFVFDPKTLWSILRLLNDDFLSSQLTGGFYEVTGKRDV